MIVHYLNSNGLLAFKVGDQVDMAQDWARRHRHMRRHTSLHLITAQATGGSIAETDSRIDFDLQDQLVDKDNLAIEMNRLINRQLAINIGSILDEALTRNPALVRTMSMQPPTGQSMRISLALVNP